MSIKEYVRKRKFEKTPEPRPAKQRSARGQLRFVVQKHAATRTHYDFRLELDGTLKSWAVPKGPTLTSQDPRLAVHVEDHPIEYGKFEGVIPKGNYGAGTVMIWDSGTYLERNSKGASDGQQALREGLARGHLTFILHGEKLRGEFALVKLKKKGAADNAWLLIKKHDEEASRSNILLQDRSTASGRSMEEIAAQAEKKGEVWFAGKGRKTKKNMDPPKKVQPLRSSMPRRTRPMEPVFTSSVPNEKEWIFEKFADGYRAIAEVERTRVRLYSRAFLPIEKKYPTIVESLKKLDCDAVLDGEVIRDGKDFTYVVSDLLFLNGRDLRELSLKQRKGLLSKFALRPPLRLAKSTTKVSDLENASMVVAKNTNSSYHSGLTRDWLRFRVGGVRFNTTPSDRPSLTHLNKIFWPKEGYTKGDLLAYYDEMAEVMLPYLRDRPESLHRQPDGLRNEGFFHKDMSSFLPRRIETIRIYSASSEKTINYALCQDKWSLLYLVNLGCIELNPWLSRRQHLDNPDLVVIDVDPDGNDFKDVVKVARAIHDVLKAVGAESFCKTSGATGLHVCIPTGGRFDYDVGRAFAESVCRTVNKRLPLLTSVERNPAKRRRKIYLDFLQNRRGQTLAAPYCVRPRPKATVSAPLKWSEVKPGLKPNAFTTQTMQKRLTRVGDLWKPMLKVTVDIEKCMKRLVKRYPL